MFHVIGYISWYMIHVYIHTIYIDMLIYIVFGWVYLSVIHLGWPWYWACAWSWASPQRRHFADPRTSSRRCSWARTWICTRGSRSMAPWCGCPSKTAFLWRFSRRVDLVRHLVLWAFGGQGLRRSGQVQHALTWLREEESCGVAFKPAKVAFQRLLSLLGR